MYTCGIVVCGCFVFCFFVLLELILGNVLIVLVSVDFFVFGLLLMLWGGIRFMVGCFLYAAGLVGGFVIDYCCLGWVDCSCGSSLT